MYHQHPPRPTNPTAHDKPALAPNPPLHLTQQHPPSPSHPTCPRTSPSSILHLLRPLPIPPRRSTPTLLNPPLRLPQPPRHLPIPLLQIPNKPHRHLHHIKLTARHARPHHKIQPVPVLALGAAAATTTPTTSDTTALLRGQQLLDLADSDRQAVSARLLGQLVRDALRVDLGRGGAVAVGDFDFAGSRGGSGSGVVGAVAGRWVGGKVTRSGGRGGGVGVGGVEPLPVRVVVKVREVGSVRCRAAEEGWRCWVVGWRGQGGGDGRWWVGRRRAVTRALPARFPCRGQSGQGRAELFRAIIVALDRVGVVLKAELGRCGVLPEESSRGLFVE